MLYLYNKGVFILDTRTIKLKNLENISASPVRVSGGYIFRSDGSFVCASTGGTIILEPGKAYIADSGSLALESSVQTVIGLTA